MKHSIVGQVADLSLVPTYAPEDATLTGAQRFDMLRVRFQLENPGDGPLTVRPRLEYRLASGGTFMALPAGGSINGTPFYVGPEWIRSTGRGGGTVLGPDSAPISAGDLRTTADATVSAVPGNHSMGFNPGSSIALPARSYTEVEFSIRATTDAQYLSTYEFRISDDGTVLVGAVAATIQMGAKPPLEQSAAQFKGRPVGPAPSSSAALDYHLVPIASIPVDLPHPATPASGSLGTTQPIVLLASALTPAPGTLGALGAPQSGTHGPYGMAADQCALCHKVHTAQGPSSILVTTPPQSSLCFQCHDAAGTGANSRVQAQYTDPLVPVNDPSSDSYYRHDALAPNSGHTLGGSNEFGGVSNRHDECTDCHNAHTPTGAPSTQTAAGWTAPGQLLNASAVSVTNGAAGTAPTYTFLNGSTGKIDLEYQLCLKCHSGFTVLPAKDPSHPSWWAEDKAIELNPSNASYHPVEAPGKNTSAAMANSLAGTSPYKQWSFTTGSTVRCVNCHGDYRKVNLASPPDPGSDLAPHANEYRGNLIQNYRDRVLKPANEAYQAMDFALCYLCHAEAPFTDQSGSTRTDTNFSVHGFHVSGIRNRGANLGTIDTPGAGTGNAICAECHFRTHSTAFAGDFRSPTLPQTGTNGGLVNFAPDVTTLGGEVNWTKGGPSSGSCTLTCHGFTHDGETY